MFRLVYVFGLSLVSVTHAQPGYSCKGHCGKWAQYCWCNDECVGEQDCCNDYQQECGGPSKEVKQVLFSSKKYPDALCLDGSPGGYFVREGSADHIIIYFQGGGWCYDQNGDAPT